MGASCEPPAGRAATSRRSPRRWANSARDLFVVVEQDMYPVEFDVPKPIAQRTRDYLRDVGIGGRGRRTMTVRVGVIGTGMIGQDHIRRITQVLSGVRRRRGDRRRPRPRRAGRGRAARRATVHPTGQDLIADGDVDAVLVTPGADPRGVRARRDRRRQAGVLREAAGADRGRPACGSSRPRWRPAGGWSRSGTCAGTTPAYRALKEALDAGEIGAPLLMHCAHRNPSVPPYGFTTDMIDQRHRGARDRPGALAVRRGDRGRQRPDAAAGAARGAPSCRTR